MTSLGLSPSKPPARPFGHAAGPDPREFGRWQQAYNGAASWILVLRIAKELGIVIGRKLWPQG